jgi:BolA protein
MVAQGGSSGETHFFIDAISASFSGQAQLARHRRINALMREEFDAGLHALSLRLKTPEEDQREKERMKSAQ